MRINNILAVCFCFAIGANLCYGEKVPLDVDVCVKRGFEHLKNKHYWQQALEDFDQAIKFAPDYVDAYIGKAIIYKKKGKWAKAKEVLLECRDAVSENAQRSKYLAKNCWQQGFFILARDIDRRHTPDADRQLLNYQNEVYVIYGYDWVVNRPDWKEIEFSYAYHFRPDITVNIFYSHFDRSFDEDFLVGIGGTYKYNYLLCLSYEGYYSDKGGIVAQEKHRPAVGLRLPFFSTLTVGANLDKFSSGWAKILRVEATKYMGRFYGKYKILVGQDNGDEEVATHIVELGAEKENCYNVRLGYSSGNESTEKTDSMISSDINVDTYYFSLKYYLSSDWGLVASGAREYRDEKFYRVTSSLGVFTYF